MSCPLPGRGLRWLWLAAAVLGLQLTAIHAVAPLVGSGLLGPFLVVTHALLLPFLIANRRLWGMGIVAVGLALNVAVMLANGGLMPVSPSTVEQVGRHDVGSLQLREHVPGTKNVLLEPSDTRLSVLSDAILVDAPPPLRKAVSVGDLLIFAGVIVAFVHIFVVDWRRKHAGMSRQESTAKAVV